jgi:hypothetical protein
MMLAGVTVTVNSIDVDTDDNGDSTSTPTSAEVTDVLFAPRSSDEHSDSRSPTVITGATLYKRGPGLTVGPNDTITIAGVSSMVNGTWQVVGEPGCWGTAGTEVAVKRVS